VRRLVATLAAVVLLATFADGRQVRKGDRAPRARNGCAHRLERALRLGRREGLDLRRLRDRGPGNEPKKGGSVALMTADGHVTILNSTILIKVFSRAPSSAWLARPFGPATRSSYPVPRSRAMRAR
jgi:hypothetical protein